MDTTNPPVELDPLAPAIEEHLLLTGMSATQFGYTHFGDPAFVLKMRRGRRFHSKTIDKINRILEGTAE